MESESSSDEVYTSSENDDIPELLSGDMIDSDSSSDEEGFLFNQKRTYTTKYWHKEDMEDTQETVQSNMASINDINEEESAKETEIQDDKNEETSIPDLISTISSINEEDTKTNTKELEEPWENLKEDKPIKKSTPRNKKKRKNNKRIKNDKRGYLKDIDMATLKKTYQENATRKVSSKLNDEKKWRKIIKQP